MPTSSLMKSLSPALLVLARIRTAETADGRVLYDANGLGRMVGITWGDPQFRAIFEDKAEAWLCLPDLSFGAAASRTEPGAEPLLEARDALALIYAGDTEPATTFRENVDAMVKAGNGADRHEVFLVMSTAMDDPEPTYRWRYLQLHQPGEVTLGGVTFGDAHRAEYMRYARVLGFPHDAFTASAILRMFAAGVVVPFEEREAGRPAKAVAAKPPKSAPPKAKPPAKPKASAVGPNPGEARLESELRIATPPKAKSKPKSKSDGKRLAAAVPPEPSAN